MSEHPILYTRHSVRRIAEGRKWQTRRIAKLPESIDHLNLDRELAVALGLHPRPRRLGGEPLGLGRGVRANGGLACSTRRSD